MDSTSSRYADFLASGNRARGHVLVDGAWTPKYQRDPDAQSPAGGVSSSVNDMTKWMRFELSNARFDGRQIVAESALAETHRPHMLTGFSPLTGLPSFYGLGWNVSYDDQGRLRLGHSGAFALGAATAVELGPSQDLGIVVLTNAYPVGVAEGLVTAFIDSALHGTATRDWLALFRQVFSDPAAVGVVVGTDYSKPPSSPPAALATSAYLGTYSNSFYGDALITEKDEGLALIVGPQRLTFPLKHFDRGIFTFITEEKMPSAQRESTSASGQTAKLRRFSSRIGMWAGTAASPESRLPVALHRGPRPPAPTTFPALRAPNVALTSTPPGMDPHGAL